MIIRAFLIGIMIYGYVAGVFAKGILRADLIAPDTVEVVLDNIEEYGVKDFALLPKIEVKKIVADSGKLSLCLAKPVDLKKNYILIVKGLEKKNLRLTKVLDGFYSEEPLGCYIEGERTYFSIFAPRALKVTLELFTDVEQKNGKKYKLKEKDNGIWKVALNGKFWNYYYGYRVEGPEGKDEQFDSHILIADPYSFAVATRNNFHHNALTKIISDDFDWEGDCWMSIDYRDLIIYELHIRDLTADISSGVPEELRGTYLGLINTEYRGGLKPLKELGVNALEFLPCNEFANIELPYKKSVGWVTNNWNPYSRNHWGYMTSYYLAPESYYASEGNLRSGEICGIDGNGVKEFKQMVKKLHKEGFVVLIDVVYNHTSQYDYNPFKYIDKKYYYKLDEGNNYLGISGCGNDFDTTRPMVRRLILDSLKRWMVDFHVDGFRFDMARMIDWGTLDLIKEELTKINPYVILIAEPWGGGEYDPQGMSKHGFAAWNDQFRNTIKGSDPENSLGFIFGHWWEDSDLERIKNLITGSWAQYGGLFQSSSHSVNYLQSHDDYTLGDFIRIACGELKSNEIIIDRRKYNKLSPRQMALNKLGALILLTSQGPVMIGEGQEYGISKVIVPSECPDPNVGHIDHNSYEKDNETNWLNYDFREDNRKLVDYYADLIAVRKRKFILRYANPADYQFFTGEVEFSLGFILENDSSNVAVLLNGNQVTEATFSLPPGNWQDLFDLSEAKYSLVSGEKGTFIRMEPISGAIFDIKK